MSDIIRISRKRGTERTDNVTNNRTQPVLYWEINGTDRYGQPSVSAPIQLYVRVEKGLVESLQPNGSPVAMPMQINVDRQLKVGGILWLGELDLMNDPADSFFQIHEYEEIPHIRGRKFDRWVKCLRYKNTIPTVIRNRVLPT